MADAGACPPRASNSTVDKPLVRRVTRGAGPPVRRTSSSRKELKTKNGTSTLSEVVTNDNNSSNSNSVTRTGTSSAERREASDSEDNSMYAIMVDTVAGIFGGCAGKAVEYPADTVKVKLQAQGNTGTSYTGPLDCVRQTLRSEGIRGLYTGLPVPLIGSMAEMAVLFTAMGRIKRIVAKDAEKPTLTETCFAGAGAGICATFVLTPVELVKCRLQTGTYEGGGGAFAAVHQAVRSEGIRVLYKGFLGTLLREVPGTAAWFGMYEWTLGQLTAGDAQDEEPAAWKVIAAGGAGGMGYWGAFYPADTVKTEMQTRSTAHLGKGASAPSFLQTFAAIYRNSGLRGLYAGLGPTLLRAIPANAAVFYVYDLVSRGMLGMDTDEGELLA